MKQQSQTQQQPAPARETTPRLSARKSGSPSGKKKHKVHEDKSGHGQAEL